MNELTHTPGLEGYSRLLSAAQSVADESVRRLQELADRYPDALPQDALAKLLEEGPHHLLASAALANAAHQ